MVFQVLFEILKQYLFILFSRFRAFHPTSLNLQIAKKNCYNLQFALYIECYTPFYIKAIPICMASVYLFWKNVILYKFTLLETFDFNTRTLQFFPVTNGVKCN